MSIKLAKKCLSLSLILIFLDTTSVDSTENYRIFDRDYSLATETVFFDGNIDRAALGSPGIFGNYLEKSFPNVEAFINNLKDEFGHAKLHKLKRNNIDYNIFEVFNPKVASKGFLISKSDNVIIGYCFFDKPFIVNKDHPGSPISRIESLDMDQNLLSHLKNSLTGNNNNLHTYVRLDGKFVERYTVSKQALPAIPPHPNRDYSAYFIFQDAYYPAELDKFFLKKAREVLPKLLIEDVY